MAVKHPRTVKTRPPLDAEGLEQIALSYAGRYATTKTRLLAYLRRKLRDRGWKGEEAPPLERLIERMVALGYVDDRAFAAAKAASLGRRGYGERRVREALRAAGIDAEDVAEAETAAHGAAWTAALRFAERRRIGPFAAAAADRSGRQKAIAAMLRAGHSPALARRIVDAKPGEIPEADTA